MSKTLNTRIKHAYKTANEWTQSNPVLLEGELGVESDTKKFKFGDGTSTWTELEYSGFDNTDITELQEQVSENTSNITNLESNFQTFKTDTENSFEEILTSVPETYATKEELNNAVAGVFHFEGEADSFDGTNIIIDGEPLTGMAKGDVYQVGEKEYAYNGTVWVELGFNIDLSNYATKTELNNKVDKVDGSRLISGEEATKLEGVETGAEVNLIESIKIKDTALPIADKQVTIPTASSTQAGVASFGSEFLVQDGAVSINEIDISKLTQVDELILNCNDTIY